MFSEPAKPKVPAVRDLISDEVCERLEAAPNDEVMVLAKPVVSEPTEPSAPAMYLRSDVAFEGLEAEVKEVVKFLNIEVCSARPPAGLSETVKNLRTELLSSRLEL